MSRQYYQTNVPGAGSNHNIPLAVRPASSADAIQQRFLQFCERARSELSSIDDYTIEMAAAAAKMTNIEGRIAQHDAKHLAEQDERYYEPVLPVAWMTGSYTDAIRRKNANAIGGRRALQSRLDEQTELYHWAEGWYHFHLSRLVKCKQEIELTVSRFPRYRDLREYRDVARRDAYKTARLSRAG